MEKRFLLIGNDIQAKEKFISELVEKHSLDEKRLTRLQLSTNATIASSITITKSVIDNPFLYVFNYFDRLNKRIIRKVAQHLLRVTEHFIVIMIKDIDRVAGIIKKEDGYVFKTFNTTSENVKKDLHYFATKYMLPHERKIAAKEVDSRILTDIISILNREGDTYDYHFGLLFGAAYAILTNMEIQT